MALEMDIPERSKSEDYFSCPDKNMFWVIIFLLTRTSLKIETYHRL